MARAECIDQYEAQHLPQPSSRRWVRPPWPLAAWPPFCPTIDPQDCQDILGRLVATAPAGPEGRGFSLWVSHEPTTDPAG